MQACAQCSTACKFTLSPAIADILYSWLTLHTHCTGAAAFYTLYAGICHVYLQCNFQVVYDTMSSHAQAQSANDSVFICAGGPV